MGDQRTQLPIEILEALIPLTPPWQRALLYCVCKCFMYFVGTHAARSWQLYTCGGTCLWRRRHEQRVFSLLYQGDCNWWVKTEARTNGHSWMLVEKHIIAAEHVRWPSTCFYARSLVAPHVEDVQDVISEWRYEGEMVIGQTGCTRTGHWIVRCVTDENTLHISRE